jgi:hypothetical protein
MGVCDFDFSSDVEWCSFGTTGQRETTLLTGKSGVEYFVSEVCFFSYLAFLFYFHCHSSYSIQIGILSCICLDEINIEGRERHLISGQDLNLALPNYKTRDNIGTEAFGVSLTHMNTMRLWWCDYGLDKWHESPGRDWDLSFHDILIACVADSSLYSVCTKAL